MCIPLDVGFEEANNQNLPKIDIFAVTDFIKRSDDFDASIAQNVTQARLNREKYGDQGIDYVCVSRAYTLCSVKCQVGSSCQTRGFSVSLIFDENNGEIFNILCSGCESMKGGCAHAIALLMWMHRRSEDPPTTEIVSYWRKPGLSEVGKAKIVIKPNELKKENGNDSTIPSSKKSRRSRRKRKTSQDENAKKVMKPNELSKENENDSSISSSKEPAEKEIKYQISQRHLSTKNQDIACLSLRQLFIMFKKTGKESPADFLTFAKDIVTTKLCSTAEELTRGQTSSRLWLELRLGRVTASRLYDASRSKTGYASLIREIMTKRRVNRKCDRKNKDLEKMVVAAFEEQQNLKCRDVGLVLLPSWPVFGASPDAVGEDFILEIKCPKNVSGIKNYTERNKVTRGKCKAQMQLQMLATNMKKGFLCVADPSFEETKKITVVQEDFDEEYVTQLMEQATEFWEKFIFPTMCQIN